MFRLFCVTQTFITYELYNNQEDDDNKLKKLITFLLTVEMTLVWE